MRAIRWAAIVLVLAAGAAFLLVRGMLASDLVRSTIERQLAAYTGQPVRIGSAGASIFPSVAVTLHDLSIGAEPAPVQVDTVRVVTGWAGLFNRRVTEARVVIADGRIAMPLPFPLASAGGKGARPAPEDASSGLVVESVREISVRNVRLAADGAVLAVNLEASLDGDRLNVSSLDASGERSRIHASGTLTSLAAFEGKFEAKAEPLDLDEMMGVVSGLAAASAAPRGDPATSRVRDPATSPPRDPAIPIHLTISVTAPAGRFAGYPFQDLQTVVDLTPGRVVLSPLALALLGGHFRGSLDADTSESVPRLELAGRVDGVDVSEVMKTTGSAGGITGQLGGTMSVTSSGSQPESLLRGAQGSITAAVTNGTIPHLDLVREIVLAFGKPSGAPPQGSGSAFSRLGGTLGLASGVLRSDDLQMQSRDFDLSGRGSLRLATGAVDARADVVLSEELTAQAGVDLRRYAQENGRVVVPATVGGTLQHPVVSIDLAAATGRALRNELRRRATDFLDKFLKKK